MFGLLDALRDVAGPALGLAGTFGLAVFVGRCIDATDDRPCGRVSDVAERALRAVEGRR